MDTFTPRHIVDLSAMVASDRFSTGQSNRELHRRDISSHLGQAGDGNLHVVLVGDPAEPAEWSKLEAINHAIVEKSVQMGGVPARASTGWASASANSCSSNMGRAIISCARSRRRSIPSG